VTFEPQHRQTDRPIALYALYFTL